MEAIAIENQDYDLGAAFNLHERFRILWDMLSGTKRKLQIISTGYPAMFKEAKQLKEQGIIGPYNELLEFYEKQVLLAKKQETLTDYLKGLMEKAGISLGIGEELSALPILPILIGGAVMITAIYIASANIYAHKTDTDKHKKKYDYMQDIFNQIKLKTITPEQGAILLPKSPLDKSYWPYIAVGAFVIGGGAYFLGKKT